VSLLILEEVHTYYGEAHILQGVSLTVGEGEVVTLIGRNGAGKTTTLRSIMGIVKARRGRVRLRGEDITGLGTDQIARRGIAWIPEERRVLPNLTVLENLRLGMLGGSRPNGGADVVEQKNKTRIDMAILENSRCSPRNRIQRRYGHLAVIPGG